MFADRARRRRRRRVIVALGTLVVALAAVGGAWGYLSGRNHDVSNPNVEFRAPAPAATPAGAPPDRFRWAFYGYSRARTRYLPAPAALRPPFRKRWTVHGRGLLEFSPVVGGRSLYLLKNNGALYAIAKQSGRVRWKRKVGALAASSPAFGGPSVYAVVLARAPGAPGRVAAFSSRNGRERWQRDLPSRAESSPVLSGQTLYFGTENGTVYALSTRDGHVRWTYHADGAVKGGPALADGKLYFGDYSGKVYAIRALDGRQVWKKGTSGANFGLSSGQFYSTPAVAFGRVYLGNTDGKVYSFATDSGALAWRKTTGNYVYGSPAVADIPELGPTVYIGSYNGTFYALNARTGDVRWSYHAGGKISGSATVIGNYVYFSDLTARTTIGLGARTGRQAWHVRTGAFNPVVSDGRRIYLTGYSSLYGMVPRRPRGSATASRTGTPARASRAFASATRKRP
jgi:outer membrane protein assembly factor BamB